MAGTSTVVRSRYGDLEKIAIAWTSSAGGAVDATIENVVGEILRVAFNPGATAPTDDYDVVITDADGLDVLAAQGANRDTANSEHICPGVALKDGVTTSVRPIVVFGTLTLAITNAGDSKVGALTLYIRHPLT